MPTRLYITNSAPAINPSVKGAWDDPNATLNRLLDTSKAGVAATSAVDESSSSGTFDVLQGRWISPGLASDTTFTSGTDTVKALAGDRIVVEFGYQAQNTTTVTQTGTMNYGNTGATDLTDGSVNVTT